MTSELKVDKITPASGTNTQIGEAGDTTNLSAGTVTLPTSIITGATEKTSLVDADKFLIADSADSNAFKHVQKSNMPSGALVRLYSLADNTTSVSNITIDNVFSADYDDYLVLGDLTSADNAQNLRFLFRDGSGDKTGTEYDHRMLFATTGDSAGTQNSISATNQTYGRLTDSSNNDTQRVSARIALHIFNPFSSSRRASITMTNRHLSSGAQTGYTFGVNEYKASESLTGIKFYWPSGNVTQSRLNIYGYKKS